MLPEIARALSRHYDPQEARAIAQLLLEHIGFKPNEILTKLEIVLSEEQKRFKDMAIERLSVGEPIQHILGYAYFMDLKIRVTPDVLIPRSETEELVGLVINRCDLKAPIVLDIGTGSGCIALAIKRGIPESAVFACDVSERAIEVAKGNSMTHNLEINFFQTDILHTATLPSRYDIIVSNPPYVLEYEKGVMQKNVLEHEPKRALFVPNDDPLVYYECILELSVRHLNAGGILFLEINESKGTEVRHLLNSGHFKDVQILKDLNGKDRFASARIP